MDKIRPLTAVREAMVVYVHRYNDGWLNSAIGYRTPLEINRQALEKQSSQATAA